jgi:polar amino acid transport system substrate-binding protein
MGVNSSFVAMVAAGCGASLFWGCADDLDLLDHVLDTGELVVSVDEEYPPQSSRNDQGELVGFDVDVAREVADRLGVSLSFETPDWDALVAADWEAQFDLSIGSMTPIESRAQGLLFSNAYYFAAASFAVHDDNLEIVEAADLEGKRIGLARATTYEDYLRGELQIMSGYGGGIIYDAPAGVSLHTYDLDALALDALALGDGVELDAVLSAHPTIQNAMTNDGQPFRLVGTPAFYEPLVFALDRSRGLSDKFLARLNEIIEAMHSDGTLRELSQRWYQQDLTTLVQG